MDSASPFRQPLKKYLDYLFLSAALFLSVIPYVNELGFYGIDWSYLGWLTISSDQSLSGLFKFLYGDGINTQPGRILYMTILYRLFGLSPLGYHLINTFVLSLNVLFLYSVLKILKQRRLLCISVALLFAFLPHYSTTRFWMQAFILNLSMSFYFLSIYCDLRAFETKGYLILPWKLMSVAGIICSILIHDIFIPFFFFNGVLLWYRRRQDLHNQKNFLEKKPPYEQRNKTAHLKLASSVGLNFVVLLCLIGESLIFS